MKKSSIICITTGFIFVIIGLTALFSLPIIILKLIYSKLVLIPSNPSFDLWKDLPLPIYQKFYFFNVTNAEDVQKNGVVPHLQEVGPFVYRMDIKKSKMNFTDSQQSVTFAETMTYYFEKDLSFADQTLQLTTLNAPLAIAIGLIEPLPPPIRATAILALDFLAEPFFVKKTVEELLFVGYPDLLTKLGPILNPKIPFQPNFGWMYDKNVTEDGLFQVNTGKTDLNKLNSIEMLDGLPQLTYWSGDHCNSFTGSKNGELFNPLSSDQKSILFFRTNFCRMWTLIWKSAFNSYLGDLPVYRFLPSDNTFANFTDYPPNKCFTPNSTKINVNLKTMIAEIKSLLEKNKKLEELDNFSNKTNKFLNDSSESESASGDAWPSIRQFPSGIFDLSACHYGAPTFLSFPHFINADKYYLNTVSGLEPNATLHETYLDIEPVTGTPVDFAARLQLNVFVNPPTALTRYRKMPKIIFPVFWQEFTIHMTQELAKNLHWSLRVPSMIATIVSSLIVATGVFLLLFIISMPLWKRCGHKNVTNIDSDSDALISDNNEIDSNDNQPVIS